MRRRTNCVPDNAERTQRGEPVQDVLPEALE